MTCEIKSIVCENYWFWIDKDEVLKNIKKISRHKLNISKNNCCFCKKDYLFMLRN